MQFEFTKEEFNDLIYAAREATIRFTRARSEFRKGNKVYSHWTEEELEDRMQEYVTLESKLVKLYESAFGEEG